MNRYGVLVAAAMFVLGAVVGHSVVAPATSAARIGATSALELMMTAPNLADTTSADAV
jgi:hypothetical protein